VAAWVGLRTFRSQRTASDVQLALGIFGEINRYWDRISDKSGSYEFNIGQILAQFEIAAGLFNRSVLTKEATDILGDHIVEVFTHIRTSPGGEGLIEQCRSSHSTFSELNKFIKKKMPQALNAIAFREKKVGQS
jgi:hypothetical protein